MLFEITSFSLLHSGTESTIPSLLPPVFQILFFIFVIPSFQALPSMFAPSLFRGVQPDLFFQPSTGPRLCR